LQAYVSDVPAKDALIPESLLTTTFDSFIESDNSRAPLNLSAEMLKLLFTYHRTHNLSTNVRSAMEGYSRRLGSKSQGS
jgi:hypothetical protein